MLLFKEGKSKYLGTQSWQLCQYCQFFAFVKNPTPESYAKSQCFISKSLHCLFISNVSSILSKLRKPTKINCERFEDQVENAITLHPFKDHKYMYRLKQYLYKVQLRKPKAKMTNLTDYIKEMNNEINVHSGNKFVKPSDI